MTTIKKTDFILTDIDEVILQWRPAFEKWIKTRGFIPETPVMTTTNFCDWLSVQELQVIELINQFLDSDGWFEDLKPREDALEYVTKLHKNGYSFIGITSCGCSALAMRKRKENLDRYFPGVFEKVHCLPLNSSKLDVLKTYPSTIWVEDNFFKAVEGVEAGHRVFLLNMPYNAETHATHVQRVADWKEIYHNICCTWEESMPGWMCD